MLEKKRGDINSSTLSVSAGDRGGKQMLTVLAYDAPHVASVEAAWAEIDAALKADTIVFVTVTDGDDRFIYTNE